MYVNELFFKARRGKEKDLKCLRVVKCKAGSSSTRPVERKRVYVKYESAWERSNWSILILPLDSVKFPEC